MKLYPTQRVLALVVGVLLAFCSAMFVLKYALPEGSTLQSFGETASIMWAVHGWVFMVYVVVSFLLARRADWPVPFTLLVLAAGLVPLLIFWVEHKVTERLRTEHPELVSPSVA